MSAELVDLRAKITMQTHLALVAYSQTHGLDQSEVVRDILGNWAAKQIHASTLLLRSLEREGIVGNSK